MRDRILASCAAQPAPAASDSDDDGKVVPFRLPAWPGWAAAAIFALLSAYLGLTVGRLDYQLALLTESEALATLQARGLDTALESERIVSREQTLRLKAAELRVAALDSELKETRGSALARVAELEAQADLAALKITALNSLLGNAPEATAIAVWNPFSQEGVLTVANLPALAPDRDYQLWVIDPQYAIPVDGGVFTVDAATGEARYRFKAGKPVETVAKFAVSLERKGGVPKAEGPMVLISP
ncbi:MAG: anti-sigma factor [Verrucomicrobiota bacterium]